MARGNDLNWQLVRAMTIVAFVALSIMFFSWMLYYEVLYPRLFPSAPVTDAWSRGDTVVLAIVVATGQTIAAYVGWKLAKKIVSPLEAVAQAARAIEAGDFGARAWDGKAFGEAERLIADFNRMAARLERAESELRFSNTAIAHELRTPLTILRGRLQGLVDGVFQPNPALYRTLLSHIEGLARLVDDLQTLSLCKAGRLELQLEQVDLAVEAEQVIRSIAPLMNEAGILLESQLESSHVLGDSVRIRQALLAVLDNCRRYAAGSTVRVEVQALQASGLVRCRDTGPGLPEEAYSLVFERFWRADDSRGRAGGGSGLGLAVVSAIVRVHRGTAVARRGEQGGMVVELWFPSEADGVKSGG